MRLLGLRIKNIASLKGEHCIWFKDISRHSPLFAITGETGAGKSSILNAVGLALYGEVYKKNVDQLDVVTLGEKEGQIELIFQVKDKNYLALWKARVRKQDGTAYSVRQSPQREIYSLNGEGFDSPKVIQLSRANEILNLDFDQFCKCVILNQGEFARFLTSTFTERKDILEKLYPGELLDSLGKELKSEIEVLQKNKNEVEIELKTLQGEGLSGEVLFEEKKRIGKEYEDFENTFKTLEKWHSHFVSVSGYHEKFNDTKKKVLSLKEELTKKTGQHNLILTEVRNFEEELKNKKKEALVRLPRLNELSKLEEKFKITNIQYQALDKKSQELQKSIDDTEKSIAQNHKSQSLWNRKEEVLRKEFKWPLASLIELREKIGPLTDLFENFQTGSAELKIKESRLKEIEEEGRARAKEQKDLYLKIESLPKDPYIQLSKIEEQRIKLQKDWEQKQKAQILVEEVNTQLTKLTYEKKLLLRKSEDLVKTLSKTREDLLPIEATLQLQGLLNAVEVCLTHPSVKDECPVCQRSVSQSEWKNLREKISKADVTTLKAKESSLNRQVMKTEEEILQARQRLNDMDLELEQKQKLQEEQTIKATFTLPPVAELEEKLTILKKNAWELEELKKSVARIESDLKRGREIYTSLKQDVLELKDQLKGMETRIQTLRSPFGFLPELDTKNILLLKEDSRRLMLWMEHKSLGEKLDQEAHHFKQQLERISREQDNLLREKADLKLKMDELSEVLANELKGRESTELINSINKSLRESENQLASREKELKTHSDGLKFIQGQITSMDELLRDLDMQFTKESHLLRENAAITCLSGESINKLAHTLHHFDLGLDGPRELFLPIGEFIQDLKEKWKIKTSELKMELARLLERISSWEKRQDRILLLQMKLKDVATLSDRKFRLFEVLGKDELRTFVLSLVEENLIAHTNEELQKLCQGRYEIVHQSGRMRLPEFYILDKFRDGELRKISTLSGGETFMVSLAMALALAEMTRGQAEIDSLFIDEGFGTLDQDSLEDVVDMLKQIQTRGLMVGVISHIKALTNSMPVNLVVTKRQDGTSSLTTIHN